MSNLMLRHYRGGESTLPGEILSGLKRRFRGKVLQARDDEYDDARRVWNAMIDRHPALILRCRNTEDVAAAVALAREHDGLVAVRGGGHHIAGYSVCDAGILIDLSEMTDVDVDPDKKTIRVSGGATLGDLDRATQEFGLAVPGGVVSTTGVAGLTLGGGFGRLSRKFGLTIDNLVSAEVVTANGDIITASPDINADLFWGLRGGGGNFGVVTTFEFKLHEVGPQVLFGPIVYSLEDAPSVLKHYRDFAIDAPRECCIWADLLTAPPLPFLPEHVHGKPVLFVGPLYAGDLQTGTDILQPLRDYGEPIVDLVGPVPYTASQSALDDLYAHGMRNYWKSANFDQLSDSVIDTIITAARQFPTPQSDILICHLGGAINDIPPEKTAYPHRSANFIVAPGARWQDSIDDDACIKWISSLSNNLKSQALEGAYVNFITERGQEGAAFGSNYPRLQEVKAKYDPDNFFRLNQNILPRA